MKPFLWDGFMLSDSLHRFAPYLLSVLRIVTALLLLQFGTAKLLGFPQVRSPARRRPGAARRDTG